jgi:hypothetical protein
MAVWAGVLGQRQPRKYDDGCPIPRQSGQDLGGDGLPSAGVVPLLGREAVDSAVLKPRQAIAAVRPGVCQVVARMTRSRRRHECRGRGGWKKPIRKTGRDAFFDRPDT